MRMSASRGYSSEGNPERARNHCNGGCKDEPNPTRISERGADLETRQEEEYVFYRMASGDMLQAQHSLKQIARYKRTDPRRAFFQQAVLSCCRPFRECRGARGKYRLSESFVPREFRALHSELTGFRNQAFAHLDLRIRTPTLGKWRTGQGCIFPISIRGLRCDHLVNDTGPFRNLIDAVIGRIDQRTKELEARLT